MNASSFPCPLIPSFICSLIPSSLPLRGQPRSGYIRNLCSYRIPLALCAEFWDNVDYQSDSKWKMETSFSKEEGWMLLLRDHCPRRDGLPLKRTPVLSFLSVDGISMVAWNSGLGAQPWLIMSTRRYLWCIFMTHNSTTHIIYLRLVLSRWSQKGLRGLGDGVLSYSREGAINGQEINGCFYILVRPTTASVGVSVGNTIDHRASGNQNLVADAPGAHFQKSPRQLRGLIKRERTQTTFSWVLEKLITWFCTPQKEMQLLSRNPYRFPCEMHSVKSFFSFL